MLAHDVADCADLQLRRVLPGVKDWELFRVMPEFKLFKESGCAFAPGTMNLISYCLAGSQDHLNGHRERLQRVSGGAHGHLGDIIEIKAITHLTHVRLSQIYYCLW